jgi:Protein of unknown function (DUF2934)
MKTPRTPKEAPEHDLEQQKHAIAYQLWEDEGRPEGKAEAHWQQACLVVMSLTETEASASPVWLKRHPATVTTEAIVEEPTAIEGLGKRVVSRHAA